MGVNDPTARSPEAAPPTLTYAQAAAHALAQAMADDPRVVCLGEDLGRGGIFGQYGGLLERFGAERVIDTPISESTIMGAAVGMALAGLVPVAEMRVIDFALCGMDEIVNQAAKNRYMFGGQGRVPMVARMPNGLWSASAAQHSQSLEAWFAHMPGLVVACPCTPQDNFALLTAALRCGDPVAYMEHKELWGMTGPVDPARTVELGKARRVREGSDLTIVSWSRAVHLCDDAARQLADEGVGADLIDLRTIWPWDREMVLESAARTARLLVVHEAVQPGGFGAEIAATAAQEIGCRIRRLGSPRVPVGYAPTLEAQSRLSAAAIAESARALLRDEPRDARPRPA